MRSISRETVAAVLFSQDGMILIGMKDPKDRMYINMWGISGGGVEEGESLETALQREILEETGIDISPYKIEFLDDTNTGEAEKRLRETGEIVLCKMKFNTYKVVLYDKKATQIPVTAGDDLIECRWVTKEELQTIPLNGPTQWLFKKMGLLIR